MAKEEPKDKKVKDEDKKKSAIYRKGGKVYLVHKVVDDVAYMITKEHDDDDQFYSESQQAILNSEGQIVEKVAFNKSEIGKLKKEKKEKE